MSSERAQTVPALIIGMGGSGDWVVREVKEAILRSYGEVPANIGFISIDTDRNVLGMAGGSNDAGGGDSENDAKAYGVAPLGDSERVKLGGNIRNIGEQIQHAREAYERDPNSVTRGVLPHLQRWFVAEEYANLDLNKWNLQAGAGQLRQFGRMAVFEDLRLNISLRATLTRIVSGVQTQATRDVEVIIVSSLAGGTGAGMFIDVANLVRQVTREVNAKVSTVRAFLFLPRVFATVQANRNRAMRARAFGAIRECIRFSTTDDWLGKVGYPVPYFPQDVGRPRSQVREILYEQVYMIDGGGQGAVDMQEPRIAHYPMVAEAIRSIIDASTTDGYQGVMQNLAEIRQRIGTTPACAGVGAFAMVMPVQLWKAEFENRMVREALEELVPVDGEGKLSGAAYRDGQVGQVGEVVAPAFLSARRVGDGDAGLATAWFTDAISWTLRRVPMGQPATRQVIDDLVKRSHRQLVEAYDEVTGNRAVIQDQDQAMQAPVPLPSPAISAACYPAEKSLLAFPVEQRDASASLVIQAQTYETQQFGIKVDGIRRGGVYQSHVAGKHEEHVNRFRASLGKQVVLLLNVDGGDDLRQYRARLGHTLGFMRRLDDDLTRYGVILGQVAEGRTAGRYAANAEEAAMRAGDRMQDVSGRARLIPDWGLVLIFVLVSLSVWPVWIFALMVTAVWWHPLVAGVVAGAVVTAALATIAGPAYRSQVEYLEAMDQMFGELQHDIVLEAMRQTTRQMVGDARKVKDALEGWGKVLRTEGPQSAWHRAEKRKGEQEGLRVIVSRVNAREYLFDHEYEEREFAKKGGAGRLALVKSVRWGAVNWASETVLPVVSFGGEEVRYNGARVVATVGDVLGKLNKKARAEVGELEDSVSILDYLMVHPDWMNAERFARHLSGKANRVQLALGGAPLVDEMNNNEVLRQDYNFLRMMNPAGSNAGNQQKWLDAVKSALKATLGENAQDRVVHAPSRDRHSCALVFTSDFLNLAGGEVLEYDLCKEAYMANAAEEVGGERRYRSVLQVFPAEINADRLESMLGPVLNQGYRLFDYRVVGLLEDVDRVELFLRARALGVVSATPPLDANGARRLDLGRSMSQAASAPWQLTNPMQARPSIYVAVRQFACAGQDWRSNPTGDKMVQPPALPINFDEVVDAVREALACVVPGDGMDERVIFERIRYEMERLEAYETGELARDIESVEGTRGNSQLSADLDAAFRLLIRARTGRLAKQLS